MSVFLSDIHELHLRDCWRKRMGDISRSMLSVLPMFFKYSRNSSTLKHNGKGLKPDSVKMKDTYSYCGAGRRFDSKGECVRAHRPRKSYGFYSSLARVATMVWSVAWYFQLRELAPLPLLKVVTPPLVPNILKYSQLYSISVHKNQFTVQSTNSSKQL